MAVLDKNLLIDDATVLTATGNSAWKNIGVGGAAAKGTKVRVAITAASGTSPTFDLKLEASDDASAVKESVTIPQQTTTGEILVNWPFKRRDIRRNATIGGTTPSFTVTIGVEGGDYAATR